VYNYQEDVSSIIENFITVVKESMAEGNNIFIRGFGSFINKKRAEKLARNITKNTPVLIPEHFIPFSGLRLSLRK
jgi:DNA-binding protein HU-beta